MGGGRWNEVVPLNRKEGQDCVRRKKRQKEMEGSQDIVPVS